jgi:hypothetical protein
MLSLDLAAALIFLQHSIYLASRRHLTCHRAYSTKFRNSARHIRLEGTQIPEQKVLVVFINSPPTKQSSTWSSKPLASSTPVVIEGFLTQNRIPSMISAVAVNLVGSHILPCSAHVSVEFYGR